LQCLFKLFAMATLSLTPPSMARAVRAKLTDVGALLAGALRDGMASEAARKSKCALIPNSLRPLLGLQDDGEIAAVLARFLTSGINPTNPRTYAIQFTLKPPDLSLHVSAFKRLTATLKHFEPRCVQL
jgi:hypothetical protein